MKKPKYRVVVYSEGEQVMVCLEELKQGYYSKYYAKVQEWGVWIGSPTLDEEVSHLVKRFEASIERRKQADAYAEANQ